MDPFSAVVGAIGVAGVGGQAIQSAVGFHSNYRRAEAQTKHAQSQLATIQETLQDEYFQLNAKYSAVQSSFEAIGKSFPGELRSSESTRARLTWAAKNKRITADALGQLKETELSTILKLQLEQMKTIADIRSSLREVEEELVVMKKARDLETGLIRDYEHAPQTILASSQRCEPITEARVAQWNTRISEYLGVNVYWIVSKVEGKNRYNVFLRWPTIWSRVLNGRIISSWPSWPSLSIYPSFKVQNIIQTDSLIVRACRRNDLQSIQELFSSGRAHPNDTTSENRTLLYFAICEGNLKAIDLLLKCGADPNLTFGQWGTSPLNTAFYSGHVEAVRLLLSANAELEYVNRRMWTSIRYIYDPQLSNLYSLELLDICAAQNFTQWDMQDAKGWTLFHRAAAFGRGGDIKKLLHLRASSTLCTFILNWLPIFCAINFGNESTFDVLVKLIPRRSLPTLTDSRGWTLLHLAAENGSETLITRLLRLGVDPSARSDKSSVAVPKGLPFKELTPGDIAKFCGNQDVYEQALRKPGGLMAAQADSNVLIKDNG